MAKKSSDKKSSARSGSIVKNLEKKAAKALAKAEDLLAAAKKAAGEAERSAKKAKKSAKKAKSAPPSAQDSSASAPTESSAAATATPASAQKKAPQKAPAVSADGASVTGAPPLPTPDDSESPSSAWSVSRLRGLARERGVSGYWSMRKDRLVEALTAPE